MGRGKGGSWGNSALVIGEIDAPAADVGRVSLYFNFNDNFILNFPLSACMCQ